MAKFSFLLHDDYEDFAQRYLGVDYEDLVNLQVGYSDDDDDEPSLVNYEIHSIV